jgi:hypothetical protein
VWYVSRPACTSGGLKFDPSAAHNCNCNNSAVMTVSHSHDYTPSCN